MIKQASKKAKGIAFENEVADLIISKGLDSRCKRDGASGAGTREKGDISTSVSVFGRNLGIECKNQETLKIGEWWRQVEKLETLGREPVLVYKVPNRNPKIVLVSIYLETFLDMICAIEGKDNVSSNLTENNHYDKVGILNSIKFIKQALSNLEREYNKKVLKEK